MSKNYLAKLAGISYLVIFFSAIFANFFVLDQLKTNHINFATQNEFLVRLGVMAFLVAAVFDTIVAFALYQMYKNNPLSTLSTYFRLMHAVIMGVAVFALLNIFKATSSEQVLNLVYTFNNIWLIGLLFFGFHLILLFKIINTPKFINIFLLLAGIMYIADTGANFLMFNYQQFANLFLTLVAIPSIFGEMALSIWLLTTKKFKL